MRRQVAGFTMVEVLVAVLLLAVGLVGALAMQAHAMRTRQESALLTEAMQAAATLADRIRANAAQSSAYLGFEFDAAAAVAAGDATAADCFVAECDAAALAQYDLGAFRQQLQSSLPAPRALTCRDVSAAPGGRLQWACSGEANAPIVIKIGWRGSNSSGIGPGPVAGPAVALPVALFAPGSTP
ncbi:type IV pilus modification protein PilV [Pseudoduganella eburnea]|uniref:Type IV pilus modification protein PilV n=1 Tax=Massilia eburnea TaxID=1776165 RepID=A0A6L6QB94_9BURK|nr:type IV pilus modification protein PilV [Massilia eburnea]MTW09324.1 type IV pilus modification protein PilV [Massilia eburnea]